jgi:hypothetical protein
VEILLTPLEEVADTGVSEGLFSVLYSEIGEFYRSAGPAGKKGRWEKRGVICSTMAVSIKLK